MSKDMSPWSDSPPIDLAALSRSAGPEAEADTAEKLAVLDAARLVREARTAAGLTQQQLATNAETTQSAISDIERGVGSQGPTVAVLARILTACDCALRLQSALPEPTAAEPLEKHLQELNDAVALVSLMRAHRQRHAKPALEGAVRLDLTRTLGTVSVNNAQVMQVEEVSGPHFEGYRATVLKQRVRKAAARRTRPEAAE